MSYKILTKNGIDNTNIDGARGEYFNSGMRDGIVQGALNEGLFTATASNIISLDTCELRIAGHRIVIDEPVYHTFTNVPSSDTRYAFVAQIVVDANQNVDFSLFVQSADTPLIQNDLYKTINGSGTYQVEIGKFTLTTSLSIEDVIRTIDVITGGIGKGNVGKINIGNVTTQTLDPDIDAEVDVDDRYEEDEGKEYLDFKFSIPKGDKGDKGEQGIQGIQGVQGEKGEKGDKGDTNSLSIGTVTTGEAGSQASATITGDAPNQTLNLTIPKGDKGDTGETGATGPKGDPGIETLVGTEENPINFATSMEVGKLYYCNNIFYSGSDMPINIAVGNFLVYKSSDTAVHFICCSASITPYGSSDRTIALYGNQSNSTVMIYFNSTTGDITDAFYSRPIYKLNGTSTDNTDTVYFYAPTTSGEAGQALQSNGADQAPSWNSLSTTISESSTDNEIPSALAVYNLIQNSIVSALGGNY